MASGVHKINKYKFKLGMALELIQIGNDRAAGNS